MDELEFNDHDLPLADLVDRAPATGAHPDALRAIVAKSDRFRIRGLAVALAAVAVAGPIAGYALGQSGSSGTAVASATRTPASRTAAGADGALSPSAQTNAAAPGVAAITSVGSGAAAPRQLFLRDTADGVRIRAYLQDIPTPKIASGCGIATGPPVTTSSTGSGPANPSPPPASKPTVATAPCTAPVLAAPCLPSALLEGQVSNDQVAGSSEAPLPKGGTGQPMDLVDASVVGAGEPTPIGEVLVHTTPAVAKVVLTFKGGGTDEMAPTADGYAVLAQGIAGLPVASPTKPAPPPAGAGGAPAVSVRGVGFGFPEATLAAFDKNGKQLSSTTFPAFLPFTQPGCVINGVAAGGSAVGGSVSSGWGTAESGTVSGGAGSGAATTPAPTSKP